MNMHGTVREALGSTEFPAHASHTWLPDPFCSVILNIACMVVQQKRLAPMIHMYIASENRLSNNTAQAADQSSSFPVEFSNKLP
jgi:hypothetical protein